MELLLHAIEEKLAHVTEERNRWLQYQTDHEKAGENLREFQKSFRKDILVPIGSKALMPGTLYHTNEIFVGMYRGLFVKCSADKAMAVCQHRLNEAHKRLDALDVEYRMYKDRLDLSSDDQMFGSHGQAQEIIEEYDEEHEKEWREKHKIQMREHKKREAEERNRIINDESNKDYMAILEQAELMEELENELEQLNVDSDELLREHLSMGEQKLEMSINDATDQDDLGMEIGSKEFEMFSKKVENLSDTQKIEFYENRLQEIGEYFKKNQKTTLDNINELAEKRVTEECLQNAIDELREGISDGTMSDDSNGEKIEIKQIKPVQVTRIVEQSSSPGIDRRKFNTREDYEKIEKEYREQDKSKSEILVFYKSQLRSVMKSLTSCTIDLTQKDDKSDLYEFICDRIDELRLEIHREKQIKAEEDFVDDEDVDKKVQIDERKLGCDMDDCKDESGRRKISFASEPIITTFNEDDEPWRVQMENNIENLNSLMDSTFQFFNSPSSSSASSACGDDDDDDDDDNEVQCAIENMSKNQTEYASQMGGLADKDLSTNTCDLTYPTNQLNISTINSNQNCDDSSKISKPTTLVLRFSHSTNKCTAIVNENVEDSTIRSPLDIYKQFGDGCGDGIGPNEKEIQLDNKLPNKSDTDMLKDYVMKMVNLDTDTVCRQMRENYEKRNAMKTTMSNEKLNESNASSTDIPNINIKPKKSILKNRDAVSLETHQSTVSGDEEEDEANELMQTFYTQDDSESTSFSGFTQVVGDIVERSDQQEVQSTSVSSNEPMTKKRVSLFKMNRMS